LTDGGFHYRFEAGSSPAALALHGTGGNEESLVDVARFVFPNSAILSPRGQSLDEGVPRFFCRLREGVFDTADMEVKTRELAEFLESFLKAKDLAPPYDVIGYSNGANMGLSLLFRRPELIRNLVLLRPMVPFEPSADLDLGGSAALICAGQADPIVPRLESIRLEGLLLKHGASVDLHWVNGGHNLSRDELEFARRWAEA